ncbi:MAG: phage tail sheath family protein [Nannocystis sp.]|uniref:phage tail sheath family protein n=1 Tax=Nannocystis sp. TaxID=1962667 RepID=UPI0024268E93|nr:phage tail sheath C-terminal domain-containing protein [Nannocystis sp.]MBK9757929.1 phage tail sheath family protein [Nannocystis sp.]
MPTYHTPGVYVEELSTLPPSVAEVATAIPAFIGFTEKGAPDGVEIAQISTLLEYELRFGKARPTAFTVDADDKLSPSGPTLPATKLHYAISLYFRNGGGRCYVVSIGNHSSPPTAERFTNGLAALEREDEPTLIVAPDLIALAPTEYHAVCQQMLALCKKLGDRFAILDVLAGDVAAFRDNIGTADLAYGAAYHPYIVTALTHRYDEQQVTLSEGDKQTTLAAIATTNTSRYNRIKKQLAEQRVILPPSAAIAGIYARTDRERGVWKAPANVSLSAVVGPTVQITHEQQEGLNVDPSSGKSINAIRAFPGKGTLVWGARTLAGNDNEWRYVPVRRLFIMIEESARKATSFAVFEPNDATTWLKVKGMLESYLYGLWEQGALQGSTPEAAYYVNVGLGKTMSQQDVLEGKMVVEIAVAAVRPAEFIILRFSHKLIEA